MLHNFCEVATDFPALLQKLRDPLKMREAEVVVQFPFTLPVVEEKTEEELARAAEKRKEQGRKLQEMAAKTRMEKVRFLSPNIFCLNKMLTFAMQLLRKETDFQYLTSLKESKATETKKEWMVIYCFSSSK